MGTRLNRYYNNPEIGAAMSNLASMFAPMAPQDIAAYATAEKLRTENEGLKGLYGMAADPNADLGEMDRWLAATGMNAPAQGFGARDMADATDRFGITTGATTAARGQDVSAAATRYGADQTFNASTQNNVRDNQRALITGAFGEVSQGGTRPEIPDEFMSVFDLPGVEQFSGRAPNLSQDQVMAGEVQKAIEQGLITPEDAATSQLSDIPMKDIVNATGQPEVAYASDAVGQQPYVNPGSKPAGRMTGYVTPEGRRGTGIFDGATNTFMDAATKVALPEGTVPVDLQDTTGGLEATTSNRTQATRLEAEVNYGLERVNTARTLLVNNPGVAGVPGQVRGLAQDLQAFVGEMSAAYGNQELVLRSADEVRAFAKQLGARGGYDPAIQEYRSLALELAYADAKAADPSGEVNVRELERFLDKYDGGIAGNQRVLASLDQLESSLRTRLATQVESLRYPGQEAPASNAGVAAAPATATGANGEKYILSPDGKSWVLAQ